MVYSLINKNSFDNIKKWVSRVKNLSKENTIFFLVGNKSDLNSQIEVTFLYGTIYINV
jgi:GTPase SAR1 family protein